MGVTRRRFLIGCGASALALPAVLRGAARASDHTLLPRLPILDARESRSFLLRAMSGETAFAVGAPSPTMGFNQAYLGPVVRVATGTTVEATVENGATRPVSVHWHGLLVGGDADGGPHQPIAPGEIWRPTLRIDQPAATLWYHTHLHGETGETVHVGLAGVLIVDDSGDAVRGLPMREGLDDLVLVLQDKRLDDDGRMAYRPGDADLLHGFLGNTILVNGVNGAAAVVPSGLVRLRLVNAANARNFDLGFDDGRPFHLIATDHGLLSAPVELTRLRLSPGERAELLVDFAAGVAVLVSEPHAETAGGGHMDHMGGHAMMAPLDDPFGAPFEVLSFTVDRDIPATVSAVPPLLVEPLSLPGEPVETRRFVLNDMGMVPAPATLPGMGMPGMDMGGGHGGHGGHMMTPPTAEIRFAINGNPFDMERLDLTVATGSTERWIVTTEMMGHPFHIHGARMRVVSENGGTPRVENAGWKDTVFVDGELEMLVEFPHAAPPEHPFMFHCHILEHEDRGMMGQLAVA